MISIKKRDGLPFVRFFLVWSSLSPIFLLWAARGVKDIPDCIWLPICFALFAIPSTLLGLFALGARLSNNVRTVTVLSAKDQREHLLTYLFAMLIPLYDANLGGMRDLIAVSIAFLLVVFIFWHMQLHYMNVFLALLGYRIFTVEVVGGTKVGDRTKRRTVTYAIISRRNSIPDGEDITGWRLGGNVLVDQGSDD